MTRTGARVNRPLWRRRMFRRFHPRVATLGRTTWGSSLGWWWQSFFSSSSPSSLSSYSSDVVVIPTRTKAPPTRNGKAWCRGTGPRSRSGSRRTWIPCNCRSDAPTTNFRISSTAGVAAIEASAHLALTAATPFILRRRNSAEPVLRRHPSGTRRVRRAHRRTPGIECNRKLWP